MLLKTCLRIALIVPFFASALAHAELAPLEAMNMAGLQRSLGQIVTKDYLMIGEGVRVDAAIEQRDKSAALFEDHHKQLLAYAPTPEIRQALNDAGALWQEHRKLVMATPESHQAVAVLASAERLVQQCQKVVDLFEAHNGDAASHSINRSGWNRVLTQRTAMFYMARAWGVPAPNLDADFDVAMKQFGEIMAELQKNPAPNAEIAAALRKTDAQWEFAQKTFASPEFVPTLVAVNADSMFKQLNELTRLYAGLKDGNSL